MDTAEYRTGLTGGLDEHASELAPLYAGSGSLDEQIIQLDKVKRMLFEAEWIQWGWPESVGGLRGSSILRAVLGSARRSPPGAGGGGLLLADGSAGAHSGEFAPGELARSEIPKLLRGDEI